jgi:DNA ligase-1
MLFSELADYYNRLEAVSSRLTMIDIMTELLNKSSKKEVAHIIYMTQGVLAPPFEGVEFGVAEKLVEEAISVATGYPKEEVEKDYKRQGDLGLTAQSLCGASKLKRMNANKNSVTEVYKTMLDIAQTSGSGSKDGKIRMLANLIAAATPLEAKYMARYPLGQLRLGLGDSTILEALSKAYTGSREFKGQLERAYNLCSDLGTIGEELSAGGPKAIEEFKVTLFKPIRPALAERLPTAEAIIERMKGRCAVEQKYDGFRCQIHKSGSRIKLFSRRLEETTEMFPDIIKAVQNEVRANKIIFEGEALAFNEATNEFFPFQETIQRKRKHGVDEKASEMPLHLFAFDLMYLEGEDYIGKPYERRREALEHVLKSSKTIIPSTMILTSSAKELDDFFRTSVTNGLEGIVAKDLTAPYVAGARKFSWIKMKRSYRGELSDTLDLVIIGYYLGRGSRAEFQFGGLLCAVYNSSKDVFETITRIGTGFSEAQMREFKQELDKIRVKAKPPRVDAMMEPDFWVYPKYVITVKADEITKSPTHTCGREKLADGTEVGYALRFPRIVGEETVRPDKSIEEATTTKEVIELFNQQKKVGVEEE